MKFSVFTRFHIAHSKYYEKWLESVSNNDEFIDTVWMWCQDHEAKDWIERRLSVDVQKFDCKIKFLPLDEFNAITSLIYLEDKDKYIGCVLDFDDYWSSGHLESARDIFYKNPNINVYASSAYFSSEDGNIIYQTEYGRMRISKLLLFTPIPFSSVVWRPGSIKVDMRFNRLIDQSILYNALLEKSLFCDNDHFTCTILKAQGSMSSKYVQQIYDRIKFFMLTGNFYILFNIFWAGARALFVRSR